MCVWLHVCMLLTKNTFFSVFCKHSDLSFLHLSDQAEGNGWQQTRAHSHTLARVVGVTLRWHSRHTPVIFLPRLFCLWCRWLARSPHGGWRQSDGRLGDGTGMFKKVEFNNWPKSDRAYIKERPRASAGEGGRQRGKLITSEHLGGIGSVSVNKHLKLQLSSPACVGMCVCCWALVHFWLWVCVFVSVMCKYWANGHGCVELLMIATDPANGLTN